MAEAIILPVAKSILNKLSSITIDYVVEEIKAAKSTKNDLKLMYDNVEAIFAVLEDAEVKGYTNKAIKIWLRDLKSVVYDIDDLLDEVAYYAKPRKANEGHFTRQLRYYASSSNPIISPFVLSRKIKGLREKLDSIVAKKNTFGLTERPVNRSSRDEIRDPFDGSASVREPNIMGRNKAKQDILAKVYAVRDATQLSVLPIVGMGGIGKTALARLVYGDVQHFDLKLWACVSDKFRIRQIIEDIVRDGSGDITPNQDLNTLLKKLHVLLQDKKYFLVLDDVWVEDIAKWTKLKNLLAIGKEGTVILITTRKASVASITKTNMKPYNLERLPEHVCWSIFKGLAFSEGEKARYPRLYKIGKSIIQKCSGIPLVVLTLGSLLRGERDDKEWQRIKDMDSFVELSHEYGKVLEVLKISYDKLPSHLKPCFAYLSLYGKGVTLDTSYVSYMWSALGLLRVRNEKNEIEDSGYSYFMELISRSLLQEPNLLINKVWCKSKMHDLLHDLATYILGEELSVVTLDKLTISEFSRHIVWGYEVANSLKDKEFPTELLKSRNARTFHFRYKMKHISQSFLEGIISHFSCLRILDLSASWFEELPRSIGKLKHLRNLDLSSNPIIRTLPDTMSKLLNLEVLRLHGCEKLKETPKDVFHLQSLRTFTMTTCQVNLIDTGLNKLSCLHTLSINSCKGLKSVWDIGGLTSLRFFKISNCPKLRFLPKSMKFLVSLQALIIRDCEQLDMGNGEWWQGLQSLRLFHIERVPKLKIIPDGIQSAAPSLRDLFIINCGGLIELPNGLQQFASLREIKIYNFPNLFGLPSGFRRLESLQVLEIQKCPHLTKRFAESTGQDYPLIQHIPKIVLDGFFIQKQSKCE